MIFDQDLPPGVLGIGDDCACLAPSSTGTLLTTDALVAGVHFRLDWTSARDLGLKAIAVNASDIAAMGGKPTYALLALSLHPETPLAWFDELIAGVHAGAQRLRVHVIGGNMTKTERDGAASVTVTMVGAAPIEGVKRRSGACNGDVLCLTGPVGSSRAGLEILRRGLPHREALRPLLLSHLSPSPHVEQGEFLGKESTVHAMMDLSDGLATDLPRLLAASGAGGCVDVDQLPVDPSLRAFCDLIQTPAEPFAFVGGEDYVLLASVEGDAFPELAAHFAQKFGRPLTPIGRVQSATGLRVNFRGNPVSLTDRAFKHFG